MQHNDAAAACHSPPVCPTADTIFLCMPLILHRPRRQTAGTPCASNWMLACRLAQAPVVLSISHAHMGTELAQHMRTAFCFCSRHLISLPQPQTPLNAQAHSVPAPWLASECWLPPCSKCRPAALARLSASPCLCWSGLAVLQCCGRIQHMARHPWYGAPQRSAAEPFMPSHMSRSADPWMLTCPASSCLCMPACLP